MKADVIFYKADSASFISACIAKLTRSPYTHVAIVISDVIEDGGVHKVGIMEANRFVNVRKTEIILDPSIHSIYRVKDLTNEQIEQITEYVLRQVGKKYDYMQVFGWIIRLLFHWNRDNLFNRANLLICSELIDKAFYIAKVVRKMLRKVGDVTPKDLLDLYSFEEITFEEFTNRHTT